ncbi:AbrB family transcriptional regulator [Tabrizicola thermarum]|uniref:AbrB family transcriptional regulator n=1 Tax=Tabrizicola thermarum TaxID=2670345 RepID=UPI000FFB0F35|nr:AbrB family transcriptional regulator [Tabrizicola thermarum]
MPDLARTAAGLALGTLGGGLFHALSLPLPWMLGALFATMVASVAGAPVRGPTRLRPAIVAIIGVLLGSRFTPAVIGQAGEALVTLSILLVYLAAVAAVVVPWYRFVGRQDWTTAYFAGMPGGLTEMIELGEARGAQVPAIVLAHSLRIVITIALMAFLFRVVLNHDVGSSIPPQGRPLDPVDAALLTGSAVLGAILGTRLRLPAPTFLGPLALSAAAHLTGLTDSAPPGLLVIAAQVVLGTILGCRFQGIPTAMLGKAGLLSLGATVLTLAVAALAGLAMQAWAGVGLDQAMLALAPGGLTEMGLIALAIHADVAFVALHHVVRILIVIVCAPLLFRTLLARD